MEPLSADNRVSRLLINIQCLFAYSPSEILLDVAGNMLERARNIDVNSFQLFFTPVNGREKPVLYMSQHWNRTAIIVAQGNTTASRHYLFCKALCGRRTPSLRRRGRAFRRRSLCKWPALCRDTPRHSGATWPPKIEHESSLSSSTAKSTGKYVHSDH